METVANNVNRKLPFVKAIRLIEENGRMVETKEAKAFPRKAWENFFSKEGNPILPNFNWKFIESFPKPGNDDVLKPQATGGAELQSVIKKTQATQTQIDHKQSKQK